MGSCHILITTYLVLFSNIVYIFASSELHARNESIASNTSIPQNSTDYDDLCKKVLCVPKCCPFNTYIHRRKSCKSYEFNDTVFDFSDVNVYNKDLDAVVDTVKHKFTLAPNKFKNATFKMEAFDIARIKFNLYLSETGILYAELPNAYRRWTPRDDNNFCVDYQIPLKGQAKPIPRFYVVMDADENVESNIYLTSAILVSCVFMLLVLVVYSLLPELRNIGGMILMAYVSSLFGAFLLLAVIQIKQHPEEVCLGLTFTIYFFFLASFCWMNVMSYDIWWTFRGYAKARPIHRRGEHFKFLMYCLYSWGLPLAMAIGLAVLNHADLRHMPWIITPNIPQRGCFIEGGEKLLYLYIPMLIMIVCNWIFYLMTAFNVWRLSRGTAVLDSGAAGTPASHRSQRQRFMVYLKLSVVMGLNWLLEVVSFVSPEFRVWNVTDMYNILIGVAIFLIFVCKKKIYRKLKKRFLGAKVSRWSPSSKSYASSSASDCNSSQETSLPVVCANPKGPAYQMQGF